MTSKQHEELGKLTAFQYWLGFNYTTLPTDSTEMTKRAVLYSKTLKAKITLEKGDSVIIKEKPLFDYETKSHLFNDNVKIEAIVTKVFSHGIKTNK
jgi:hypothetical protein